MKHYFSISRRHLILSATSFLSMVSFQNKNYASSIDNRFTPRTLGNPKAKVHVQEWFDLTCTHCAHFALTEFPEIKKKYIDTGRVFYQFNAFPLNQVGLAAIMVALSLPQERYFPFINSLFSRQMQWAFSDNNPLKHLQQEAALAGISKKEFNEIINDRDFQDFIYKQVQEASKKYHITGTPFFLFNDMPHAQDPGSIKAFDALIVKAEKGS